MMAVPNSFYKAFAGAGAAAPALGGGTWWRPFVFGLQHHGFSVHSLIYAEVAANKDWRRRYGNQGL
ncbi:hypothetical protein [Massilia sp.]|uniref:hypothetical protein n=1 Tax=Massilia sp. TaxID=1882437 RepID=UPI00391D4C42